MVGDFSYGVGPGEPGLVSVVIPTYQRAGVLAQAIESVLAQTYTALEVIVVDDGSTDDTQQTVARYDARVRYFRQENAGVSAARNLGLQQARGEFVALLDSDDYWLPWKLSAQVALLRQHPTVGMVWTEMSAIDETGKVLSPAYLRTYYSAYAKVQLEDIFSTTGAASEFCHELPTDAVAPRYFIGDISNAMLMGNLVHTSTVLLRRERLRQVGGFDTSLKVSGEDYDFHLRTCSYGPVALLDVPSIHYRIGAADQLSGPRQNVHMARNDLRTLEAGLKRAGNRLSLPRRLLNRRLAESHGWLGREELKAGNLAEARRQLTKSLYYRPRQPGTMALTLLSLLPRDATLFVHRAFRAARGATPS